MKQFNPFPPINCTYGAPMGRRSQNAEALKHAKRLHARPQGGSDGYDKGGAYWGTPSNIWGVWAWVEGEVAYTYVRAASRAQAIAKATGE